MANRGYLFSSDRGDAGAWERRGDFYYDSRWAVPLAWWFFFRTHDIRLVEESYDGGASWHEVKFAADKARALSAFDERRGLLARVARGPDGERLVARLFDDVGAWPGRYLLMDPQEVFSAGDEPEEGHHPRCLRILSALDAEGATAEDVVEAVLPYWHAEFESPEDFVELVVGYTYA
ncbi:MAG TPA: hypothetical protein VN282_13995 [Pyrinomonadaceae bacterium]|nr:hypothetical protein [Pyrinomonadaceae bacterium]